MAKPQRAKKLNLSDFGHGFQYIGTHSEKRMAELFIKHNKAFRAWVEGSVVLEEDGHLNFYIRESDNSWSMTRSL